MSSPPQLKARSVPVLLDGTVQRITTDTTIWSTAFTFSAHPDNGAVLYVGLVNSDNSLPLAIDNTNCLFALRGNSMPLPISKIMQDNDESYQLSQLCVQGADSDNLYVVYPKRF